MDKGKILGKDRWQSLAEVSVPKPLPRILLLKDIRCAFMNCRSFAPETLGDVLKTHEIELEGKQLNFKWFRRAGLPKLTSLPLRYQKH